MATLLLDRVKKEAKAVSKLMHEAYPDLSLMYIIHHVAQRDEAILIEEDSLLSHPAGMIAKDLLLQPVQHGLSQFVGLAPNSKFRWLQMRREDRLLGLITFNADQYDSLKHAQIDMFHQAWHALNMRMIRNRPENIDRYRHSPISPKRNPVNRARANLMADSFSAIFLSLMGEKTSIKKLARMRAEDTLLTRAKFQPELYPFPIAMEATEFALSALPEKNMSTSEKLHQAYKTSINIGKMFNAIDIHQWWGYAQPSQDMAWRGIEKMEILSAAVHTSDDPFIRSNGDLIAEILGVDSSISLDLTRCYNAFDEWEKNRETHESLIHETFDIVIAESIRDGSSRALLNEANEQNIRLSKGDFIGWCASALQAAAARFERANSYDDKMLREVTSKEFEEQQQGADVQSLSKIGAHVLNERREGQLMTLQNIEEICVEDDDFEHIGSSIAQTRKDPAYLKSFEYNNVFEATPEAPTPVTPVNPMPKMPVMTPRAPGLGGGSVPQLPVQTQQDSDNYKDSEEFV